MEVRGHQRSKVQRSRSFQSHRSKHFHLPCSVSVRNVESSNKALVNSTNLRGQDVSHYHSNVTACKARKVFDNVPSYLLFIFTFFV